MTNKNVVVPLHQRIQQVCASRGVSRKAALRIVMQNRAPAPDIPFKDRSPAAAHAASDGSTGAPAGQKAGVMQLEATAGRGDVLAIVPGVGIRSFHFARVFEQHTPQRSVFAESAMRVVVDFVNGQSGSIIVYGQTGSGKTHTMFGQTESHDTDTDTDIDAGIAPRSFETVLDAVQWRREAGVEAEMRMAYVEIYGDEIRDLLDGGKVVGQDFAGRHAATRATDRVGHRYVLDGDVDVSVEGGMEQVGITRAHLEEDLGKNFHFDRESGVDFNRAGLPLLEIVTEPDIRNADMAHAFLNALKDIMIYGGVSDFDMEKGMARCDVNISVRPVGQESLNARREIKNMNSFSGVRRALNYEIPEQTRLTKAGETIKQGTVRWNDDLGVTESMRSKEDAHDYRYFPEPDLMPFEPTNEWLEEVKARVVELPLARKRRFMSEYELPEGDADVFVQNVPLGDYFEKAAKGAKNRKAVANWVINNLRAKLVETSMGVGEVRFSPDAIPELVELVDAKRITSKNAQEAFGIMFETGQSPAAIADEQGWKPADAGEIEKFCDEAIEANPGPADDFRSGKDAALNRILGHVMKLSKGSADPGQVRELLSRKLRG